MCVWTICWVFADPVTNLSSVPQLDDKVYLASSGDGTSVCVAGGGM